MPDITCNYCGGTDFHKEAGYYFCTECQTQSQEVHEHEFDHPDETIIVHKTKKIKSSSSTKESKVDLITSWECYNYILLGLVNELIELGADAKLKPIVQTIWFEYLQELEVLHKDRKRPPSLPAFNNKYDAGIIYGRGVKKKVYKRKRRPSCSSAGSVSGTESTISKREHSRLKRAMAEAAYETLSTQKSDAESLLDVSLSSLKSSMSGTSKPKDNFLQFNKSARVELLSHMSKTHLKKHIRDTDDYLTCHDLKHHDVSNTYRDGPCVVKQSKLYAILHLALLINNDDIQLGDMIRFMVEGNLSFNHYQHFFPEDIDDQTKFLRMFVVSQVNKHFHYRETSGKLMHLLKLQQDIPVQNLSRLVRRYCKELNLPNDFCRIVINFINEVQPAMNIPKASKVIPNYETKAMSAIIFVFKLFFGLDDVTEFRFSDFAIEVPNAFNFEQWLQTICYRRLVLTKHHFPTQYLEKKVGCKEYLDFINIYHEKHDVQRHEDVYYDVISKLLLKSEYDRKNVVEFTSSLNPLHDNLKLLNESGLLLRENYMLDVLLSNFQDKSLDFLANSNQYLSADTEIVHGGANNDIKVVPIFHANRPYNKLQSLLTCQLTDGESSVPRLQFDGGIDTDAVLETFERLHQHRSHPHEPKREASINMSKYPQHFHPERRFWLRLGTDISNMRSEDVDNFIKTFPHTFRLLINECASITSQTVKDLMLEYNYFETYVCYHHFCYSAKNAKFKGDETLRKLLLKAKQFW